MTLIMDNLGFSVSLLAMVISMSMAYLKFKAEMIDKEERAKRIEKKRIAMTEASFDFGKWYTG